MDRKLAGYKGKPGDPDDDNFFRMKSAIIPMMLDDAVTVLGILRGQNKKLETQRATIQKEHY